jgi:hypothetical protein
VDASDSLGVSWARHLAFSLYQKEEYFLQVDAHTLFDLNWDTSLLRSFEPLKEMAEKPIISVYPPAFIFDNSGRAVREVESMPGKVMMVILNPDHVVTKDSFNWQFLGVHQDGVLPVKGFSIAAGFLFTYGRFIEEIPYDPWMYFSAEEKNLGIRAYTHGWTVFHIPIDEIPVAHLYRKPEDGRHRSLHWHADAEQQRKTKSQELTQIATQRMIAILKGEVVGAYGLGLEKSLAEFCQFSGIPYLDVYVNSNAV